MKWSRLSRWECCLTKVFPHSPGAALGPRLLCPQKLGSKFAPPPKNGSKHPGAGPVHLEVLSVLSEGSCGAHVGVQTPSGNPCSTCSFCNRRVARQRPTQNLLDGKRCPTKWLPRHPHKTAVRRDRGCTAPPLAGGRPTWLRIGVHDLSVPCAGKGANKRATQTNATVFRKCASDWLGAGCLGRGKNWRTCLNVFRLPGPVIAPRGTCWRAGLDAPPASPELPNTTEIRSKLCGEPQLMTRPSMHHRKLLQVPRVQLQWAVQLPRWWIVGLPSLCLPQGLGPPENGGSARARHWQP